MQNLIKKQNGAAQEEALNIAATLNAEGDKKKMANKARANILAQQNMEHKYGVSPLSTVLDESGLDHGEGGSSPKLVTDPQEAARVVTKYWQTVFSKKSRTEADIAMQNEWFANFHNKLPEMPDSYWTPTLEEVTEAIKVQNNSAAGPDGIPFGAYKAIIEDAAEELHRFICELLSNPNLFDLLPPGFNHAWLVLLPKKPTVIDPTLGSCFSPADMRPRSIVN